VMRLQNNFRFFAFPLALFFLYSCNCNNRFIDASMVTSIGVEISPDLHAAIQYCEYNTFFTGAYSKTYRGTILTLLASDPTNVYIASNVSISWEVDKEILQSGFEKEEMPEVSGGLVTKRYTFFKDFDFDQVRVGDKGQLDISFDVYKNGVFDLHQVSVFKLSYEKDCQRGS
jgi:hypothetical protein